MKKNIPLFYSILISLIVLIGGSFASYQILQEKKSAIKEEILTRAESIFYALEDSIKNEDIQAIDSKMNGFKNEIKQSKDLLRISAILLPQFYYYNTDYTGGNEFPKNHRSENLFKTELADLQNIKSIPMLNLVHIAYFVVQS